MDSHEPIMSSRRKYVSLNHVLALFLLHFTFTTLLIMRPSVSVCVSLCARVAGSIQKMAPHQKALRSQSNLALFARWMATMATAKSAPMIAAKRQMRAGLPFLRCET